MIVEVTKFCVSRQGDPVYAGLMLSNVKRLKTTYKGEIGSYLGIRITTIPIRCGRVIKKSNKVK